MNKYNEIMDKVKVTKDMRERILDNVEKETGTKINNLPDKKARIISFSQITRVAAAVALFICCFGVAGILLGRFGGERSSDSSAPTAEYTMESSEATAENETAEATEEDAITEVTESTSDSYYDAENATPIPEIADDASATEGMNSDKDIASDKKAESEDEAEMAGAIWEVNEYASAEELSEKSNIEMKDIASLKDKSENAAYLHYYNSDMAEITYNVDGSNISFRKSEILSGTELTGNYEDYLVKEKISLDDVNFEVLGKEDQKFYQITWYMNNYNYSLYLEKGLSLDDTQILLKEIIGNYMN